MSPLGWLLLAAVSLSACDKQEPAKPQATAPKQEPAKPRTVEERIADCLALGAFQSDERIQHEQALFKVLYQPPYDQFMADFHRLLLKDDQNRASRDSHTALLKTLAGDDTRPGVIKTFVSKHFSTCEGASFDRGRVLYSCKRGNGQPAADPTKGCKDYLALVLPPLIGLDQLEEKSLAIQNELLPLVEQFKGMKKEDFTKDVMNDLLPLVQKHRPDAYDKLAGLINGLKADSRARKQDSIRADLRTLHRNELRFYVRWSVGTREKEFWTGDAGSILNPPELDMVSSGKPYEAGAYLISPLVRDAKGAPYGQDSDGSGKPWGNKEGFAFVAFPKQYPESGRQTYLVNETGTIWSMDTGGKVIEAFPANLDADGWTVAEKPVPEDNLATVQFQHGLENNNLGEMRAALAAMRKRGEDTHPLLLQLLRHEQDEVRKRIVGVCAAEYEGTEDATILGALEGLCETVYDTFTMVEAVKKIAPKGYPAWVSRLRERLLKSENALHRENLARTLASAMEKSEVKALEVQLAEEAGQAMKEGKPARAVERYTTWLALHRSDTQDEYALILRLRARALLLTKDREAAKSDVQAASRAVPPFSAEDIELEKDFPEIAFQFGLERNKLDEMRAALAAMRKRGEDPHAMLLQLIRERDVRERDRILVVCVAEFEATEDAAILGVLEDLSKDTDDSSTMVEAVKKIAPKGYPAWVGRLRDRLLKSGNALHRENLARTLASAMEKSEVKALQAQLVEEAGQSSKEGKPDRAVARYTTWIDLHRGDAQDEYARILRLRARAYLLTQDREAAKADVEAARKAKPPVTAEDKALEKEFPEIVPEEPKEQQSVIAPMKRLTPEEAGKAALKALEKIDGVPASERVTLARVLLEYGKTAPKPDALRAYSGVILLDPGCAEAYLGRAGILMEEGDAGIDQAWTDFLEGRRLDPKAALPVGKLLSSRFLRSRLLAKDPLRSAKLLDCAMESDPDNVEARLARAYSRRWASDYVGFLSDIQKVASQASGDPAIRRQCALACASACDGLYYKDAPLASKILEVGFPMVDPPPVELYVSRAQLRWHTRDEAGADADYRAAGKTDPKWIDKLADLYFMYARLDLRAGHRETARVYCAKANGLRPDLYPAVLPEKFAEIWAEEAQRHLIEKRYKEGMAAIDEAIKQEPKEAGHYWKRAELLTAQEDLAGAERAMTQAVALVKPGGYFQVLRARVRRFLNDEPGAMADLKDCLRVEPKDKLSLLERAELHRQFRRWKEAIADYEEVVKLEGACRPAPGIGLWDAWNRLGDAVKAKQALAAIKDDPTKSIDTSPERCSATFLLGTRTEESLLSGDMMNDEKAVYLYWSGHKRLFVGDRTGALKRLEECRDLKSPYCPEHLLRQDLEELRAGK